MTDEEKLRSEKIALKKEKDQKVKKWKYIFFKHEKIQLLKSNQEASPLWILGGSDGWGRTKIRGAAVVAQFSLLLCITHTVLCRAMYHTHTHNSL